MATFLAAVLLAHSALSEIIPYRQHVLYPEKPEYLIIPKFAKGDAPNWKPGHGHSFIDLSEMTIHSNCIDMAACQNSTFEMIMFQNPQDKPWMDYWDSHDFCCDGDLVITGSCSEEQIGKLIVPSSLPGVFVRSIELAPGMYTSIHDESSVAHHEISTTGQYILLMSVCNPKASSVTLNGAIDSLDPYGYLPADSFANLPFYGTLSCMYSIIGIAWLILCACYSDQLIPLQLWITLVLALGMLETTTLFAHYLSWNDNGLPTMSVTVLGLVFGVTKRALSRVVVQLVALGYGIVRPSLGEDMHKVLLLGGSYFMLSLIYTIAINIPSSAKYVGDPEYGFLSLVVFMLAGVDTTFYIWIFSSVNSLLLSLSARKQAVKYVLYRNFRAVLFVSLFFTLIWALYGSILAVNNQYGIDVNWQDRWTVDALWELTYFVVFVVIAVMWAPANNTQRYAYSIELSQLDDDEEWLNGENAIKAQDIANGQDRALDTEYGGRLNDEQDPFQGTGALDPNAAIAKKQ